MRYYALFATVRRPPAIASGGKLFVCAPAGRSRIPVQSRLLAVTRGIWIPDSSTPFRGQLRCLGPPTDPIKSAVLATF